MARIGKGSLCAGILLVMVLLLAACQAAATPTAAPTVAPTTAPTAAAGGGAFTFISVSDLQGMLKNKDFTFVNVHIPYAGEIEKTDLFIPYNEIDKQLDKLPDKNARLVLYCLSDEMSTEAAGTLTKLGYTKVFVVQGGMTAWEAAGQTLIKK